MLFNSSSKKITADEKYLEDAGKMLQTISPLVKNIYRNGALFTINKGLNHLTELFFYLLGLCCIAFSFIMNSVFPFHVLGDIMSKSIFEQAITNKGDLELFNIAVKALAICIGLLFIFIGILIRSAGKRKELLQEAGKELKMIEVYFNGIVNTKTSSKNDHHENELHAVPLKEFPKTDEV